MNAYFASVAADFLRQKLLERRVSFSFETVMSSHDKVALLEKAQSIGYRTYLYYIATDDPAINVSRVKTRVNLGGHDVPEEKIVSRYERSIGLLVQAVKHSHRAYIFDNSRQSGERLWVAEITDGRDLELKCDPMPRWFQKPSGRKSNPMPEIPRSERKTQNRLIERFTSAGGLGEWNKRETNRCIEVDLLRANLVKRGNSEANISAAQQKLMAATETTGARLLEVTSLYPFSSVRRACSLIYRSISA